MDPEPTAPEPAGPADAAADTPPATPKTAAPPDEAAGDVASAEPAVAQDAVPGEVVPPEAPVPAEAVAATAPVPAEPVQAPPAMWPGAPPPKGGVVAGAVLPAKVAAHEAPVHVGIGVGLALVVALIVLAFSWPAVTADPRGVPLAITGDDPAQVAVVSAMLTNNFNGAVAFTTVDDAAAATKAIERREVYGAIVLGAEPVVYKATAASPAVAPMLERIHEALPHVLAAAAAQAQPGGGDTVTAPDQTPPAVDLVEVAFEDVAPLLADDQRGMGLAAATLPLVLGGLVGGVAISLVVTGAIRRLTALVVYAVTAGLVITALLQTWFGVLGGAYLANAAVFACCLLAIGTTIVGCASLLGLPGIPIGPVLFLLLANPIAGVTMPPEFLPSPWGAVGQLFPPGAGATLVRDISYFPHANTVGPWLVLAAWTALGLGLVTWAHLRTRTTAPA